MTKEQYEKLTPFELAVLEYLRKINSSLDDIARLARD